MTSIFGHPGFETAKLYTPPRQLNFKHKREAARRVTCDTNYKEPSLNDNLSHTNLKKFKKNC